PIGEVVQREVPDDEERAGAELVDPALHRLVEVRHHQAVLPGRSEDDAHTGTLEPSVGAVSGVPSYAGSSCSNGNSFSRASARVMNSSSATSVNSARSACS